MGIDITSNRTIYNDRNKWYKKVSVDKMTLTADAIAQGVFYSTDTVALTEQQIIEGTMKRKQYRITIETPDWIGELGTDDYVLYSDGFIYRVDKITKDDKNESKIYSSRPSVKTTLELMR